MKIYVHQGHGHWIGSHVVVVAASPLRALQMIREKLNEAGLTHEAVTLQGLKEYATDEQAVVLFDDGDY